MSIRPVVQIAPPHFEDTFLGKLGFAVSIFAVILVATLSYFGRL